MSRTIKGSKGPGYEFWSKRPGGWGGRGAYAKLQTHRIERQQHKKEAREACAAAPDMLMDKILDDDLSDYDMSYYKERGMLVY